MLPPTQGKNLDQEPFQAVGDMLGAATWELPAAEFNKGDLLQPTFAQSSSGSSGSNIVPVQPAKTDANAPAPPVQWDKVAKMVV